MRVCVSGDDVVVVVGLIRAAVVENLLFLLPLLSSHDLRLKIVVELEPVAAELISVVA